MTIRITLTKMSHGYEVNIENCISCLEKGIYKDRWEIVRLVTIENDYNIALAIWKSLIHLEDIVDIKI